MKKSWKGVLVIEQSSGQVALSVAVQCCFAFVSRSGASKTLELVAKHTSVDVL